MIFKEYKGTSKASTGWRRDGVVLGRGQCAICRKDISAAFSLPGGDSAPEICFYSGLIFVLSFKVLKCNYYFRIAFFSSKIAAGFFKS